MEYVAKITIPQDFINRVQAQAELRGWKQYHPMAARFAMQALVDDALAGNIPDHVLQEGLDRYLEALTEACRLKVGPIDRPVSPRPSSVADDE